MKKSRRDFIQASVAFGVLTVTKATAQPGSPAAGPIITKRIALVVSTKKKDNHIAAFKQALRDKNWNTPTPPLFADDKYGPTHNELKRLTNRHITNGVDLIVAAGGLPTAVAVATVVNINDAAPPFIFLVGRYPKSNSGLDADAAELYNSPTTKKVGGVDQNIPAQNGANFQALKTKGGVAIDKVGLIVNNNNPITAPEVDEWKKLTDSGNSPNPNFIYHITGENDQSISPLLNDIKTKPQPDGIVVSSDPYLREVGNANFDAQLRDLNGGAFAGWVCYPYKEYVLASTESFPSTSTPELATDDPADQKTAYYQLGLKADDALNNRPANLTQWSGSTWQPTSFP
jgi:hypothetical protein